jgi:hypothetical protein
MWNARRVLDTHPKPDGYGYGYEFLSTDIGTGMNFYLYVWVQIQISTRNLFTGGRVITLPDPLPSLPGSSFNPVVVEATICIN